MSYQRLKEPWLLVSQYSHIQIHLLSSPVILRERKRIDPEAIHAGIEVSSIA